MSNSEQASPADNEEPQASLLRSLMLAMRLQPVLEIQEALAGSHRQQQQPQHPAQTDEANEAAGIDAKPPSCKPGGYPEEIFIHLSESDKDELQCRICFSILRDCYECRNRHRFCYACVYEWCSQSGQGSNLCPVCRCPGEYARNPDVNERLGRRRVRCADAPPGQCNWRGCLGDLDGHKHRQYELQEIYTSSELPSLKPERTGDSLVPAGQRLTTSELVRRHSEAKTAAAVASAAAASATATADGGGRLLGRRQQDSARRLAGVQQQQQQQHQQPKQQPEPQQEQQQQQQQQQQQPPMEYRRLVRPRPPPPSAAQRLQESREQLALLMTLLTIQMQERQQAMQMMQLEARRREIERRRQLAEVDSLHQRLAQVAVDVSRPVQQQSQQQQRQQGQQQPPQQQPPTPRLPAIAGRRDSTQGGGGVGGGSGGVGGGSGSRTGGGRT